MGFSEKEKEALLQLKGVGPTVVRRFEEIGINSFEELKRYQAEDITEMVANMLHTTCWKNSPQARNAIALAINLARNDV